MAIKDQVVELVLRAKNLLSGDTDAAAKSVEQLAGNAEGLQQKLRSLEDQKTLITQFDRASTAVDRTSGAYDRAQLRLDKLADKIGQTGVVTERQAQEFAAAQSAVDRAEKAYKDAEGTLGKLAKEADEAGIDIANLSEAQRDNQQQTTAAKRALEDYNKELNAGDGRLKAFGKSLASGAARFAAWGAAALAAGAAAGSAILARMTANQAELARQTIASAEAFGISTTALQEWQYAANSVGIEGDKVADIMKDVSDKIGDAFLNGTGAAMDVIQQLNLDLGELINLRPDEQLLAIAEQLNGLPKPAQVQILESLAGDAALLLPLLDDNARALRELAEEAQKRGAILTDEELQRLADADKAFDRIKAQLDGFVKKVTGELAPTFERLANDIDAFLTSNPQLIDDITESFRTLITATSNWASEFLGNKDSIQGSFSTLANGATGLKETFIALFNGVQAFAAGSAEVFARVIYSVNNLYAEALALANKVGLASDESVQRAEARLDNLGQTVQDLEAKSEGYKQKMIEAGEAAAEAFRKAEEGSKKAASGTGEAAGAAKDLADSTQASGDAAEEAAGKTATLQKNQGELGRQIAATVLAIEEANAAWSEDPSEENLQRVQQLRDRYKELQDTLAGLRVPSPDQGDAEEGTDSLADAANKVNESLQKATDTSRDFVRVVDTGFGDSAQRLRDFATATQESANGVGASLAGVVGGWMSHISNLSQNALAAFKDALGDRGAGQVTDELQARLDGVNNRIREMSTQMRIGGGVGSVLRDWAQAGLDVEASFLEQAIAVRDLTQSIQEGDRSLGVLRKSAEQIKQQFDLLDDQQLSGLLGAVASVRGEVDSLKDSLDDTIASARQELAALQGNTAEVERLRFEERRLELQAQYDYARKLGDQETMAAAREAIALSEEAYRLRLRNAEEQDAAARQAAAERAADQEFKRQREEQEERQDISRETRTNVTQLRQPSSTTTRMVELRLTTGEGRSLGTINALDDDMLDRVLDAIERGEYLAVRR